MSKAGAPTDVSYLFEFILIFFLGVKYNPQGLFSDGTFSADVWAMVLVR